MMLLIVTVWAMISTIAAFVFALSHRFLAEKVREEQKTWAAREASLQSSIADARERSDAVIEHERARHTAEVERMAKTHDAAIEKVLHMVAYGSPHEKPAVVKDEEPDAESRLIAGISEDMVRIGGLRIKTEYERIGQIVSLEECEAEARSMLSGVPVQVPPERGGGTFIREDT